jgi:succinate dehydrogenase / fumarate reductase cytochrome b subunit
MKDVRDALLVARNTDGRMIQRPLSPHLQVYRPQITTILSIMNRITGVALGGATVLLVWWLLAAATSPTAWASVRAFTLSWFGLLLLFGWTAALVFHTLNGVRHLAWDAGIGFGLPATHASGWAVVAATVVVTAVIWAAGVAVW